MFAFQPVEQTTIDFDVSDGYTRFDENPTSINQVTEAEEETKHGSEYNGSTR